MGWFSRGWRSPLSWPAGNRTPQLEESPAHWYKEKTCPLGSGRVFPWTFLSDLLAVSKAAAKPQGCQHCSACPSECLGRRKAEEKAVCPLVHHPHFHRNLSPRQINKAPQTLTPQFTNGGGGYSKPARIWLLSQHLPDICLPHSLLLCDWQTRAPGETASKSLKI